MPYGREGPYVYRDRTDIAVKIKVRQTEKERDETRKDGTKREKCEIKQERDKRRKTKTKREKMGHNGASREKPRPNEKQLDRTRKNETKPRKNKTK